MPKQTKKRVAAQAKARELGVSPGTLDYHLKKHGLTVVTSARVVEQQAS